MAKVALDVQARLERRRRTGRKAGTTASRIARARRGWSVADVICTSGPRDRPFEERHAQHSIAVVLAAVSSTSTTTGGGVLTPGAVMLGNPGQCFECGHAHGEGDRCVAFWFCTGVLRAHRGGRGRPRPTGLPHAAAAGRALPGALVAAASASGRQRSRARGGLGGTRRSCSRKRPSARPATSARAPSHAAPCAKRE